MEGVLRRLSSGRQRCRYKTYPHVDYVERAAEATRLIAGMINKTCRPTMAAKKPPMIPMVTNGRQTNPVALLAAQRLNGGLLNHHPGLQQVPRQFTGAGAAKEFIGKLKRLEADTIGVLSASLLMGFPWADIPDMGAAFVVVTDGDQVCLAPLGYSPISSPLSLPLPPLSLSLSLLTAPLTLAVLLQLHHWRLNSKVCHGIYTDAGTGLRAGAGAGSGRYAFGGNVGQAGRFHAGAADSD